MEGPAGRPSPPMRSTRPRARPRAGAPTSGTRPARAPRDSCCTGTDSSPPAASSLPPAAPLRRRPGRDALPAPRARARTSSWRFGEGPPRNLRERSGQRGSRPLGRTFPPASHRRSGDHFPPHRTAREMGPDEPGSARAGLELRAARRSALLGSSLCAEELRTPAASGHAIRIAIPEGARISPQRPARAGTPPSRPRRSAFPPLAAPRPAARRAEARRGRPPREGSGTAGPAASAPG